MSERRMEIAGRESEFAVLDEFLAGDPAVGALVLTGGPGIGKTTLWEAGIAAARERGWQVLSARPSTAEAQLSFGSLIDLCHGLGEEALADLPAPQRVALEVALLRAEPARLAPEPHAIGLGWLNALRALAARERVLVAIDDVQWLDAPSADALAFAARRLQGEAVGFLFARRPGRRSALERTFERGALERVAVGPLTLGATRRVLSERLGLSVSRPLLRRIVDSTQGNPLFALEVGRALAERGPLEIGEDIPVPSAVEEMLGTRVARLPGSQRRLLLALALSADLRMGELEALAEPGALDDAIDAGLVLAEGDRVRAAHPLLAAAAKKRSPRRERRELHLLLASAVADEELRALHLALATGRPDEELARTVAAAAAGASARGARQEAVQLAEHALRLTPAQREERSERLLALGGYLETAGELQRLTDVLTNEVASLPAGAARARGWLLLSTGAGVRDGDDYDRHLELALAECQDVPHVKAQVLAMKAENAAVGGVSRIRQSEAWAHEALAASRDAGPDVERIALYALAWVLALTGRPIDHLCERSRAAADGSSHLAAAPERVAGQRLVWRGEVTEARPTMTRFLALADERGEPFSYALQRLHLCELELRAGEWDAAARLLAEWAESSEGELLFRPMYERCHALLAAGRGLPDDAERWATTAIARADVTGSRWDMLESLRARGIAELLAHDPTRAAKTLRAIWERTQREGIDDPGVFPVAPELVEALAELGDLDEARSVSGRVRELAEQQEHPWGLATAKRCGAIAALASGGYDEDAAVELAQAAADYRRLGLRFDRARSLLSLGRAQRRVKKWGAARDSLEGAVAAFDEQGSPGWTEQARSELARVGARRPAPSGELTPAELRVAQLAANGLANKEIGRTLHVTVHTVELHLSHAYAKLGIRSRTQLAGRLSASDQRPRD